MKIINKKSYILKLILFSFSFLTKCVILDEENPSEKRRLILPSPLIDFRLHKFTHGNIIYIFGSSTSGKSTLLREISKQRPDFEFISTLKMKQIFYLKTLHTFFPEQVNILIQSFNIEDILSLVFDDKRFNQSGLKEILISKPRESDSLKLIKSKLDKVYSIYPTEMSYMSHFYDFFFSYIFTLSKSGKNVVVDNLDIDKFYTYKIKYFYHAPMFYILTYLSPVLFYQRVFNRNQLSIEQSDALNIRSFMRPVETFLSIYGGNSGPLIGTVNKKQLHESLLFLYQEAKRQNIGNRLLEGKFNALIKKFNKGFGREERLSIYSKYPFDILFNSESTSSSENAKKVLSLKEW